MKRTPLKRSTPLRKKARAKTHNAIVKEAAAGRKLTRTQLIKLCDPIWSKLVKLHAHGKCEICPAEAIDSHHMVGRRHMALRWRIENGMALCRGCHLNFHNKESLTAWTLLKEKRPLSLGVVEELQYTTVKWGVADLRAIYEGLKAQLKEFGQ